MSTRTFKLFDWRILPMLAVTGVILWVLISRFAGAEEFAAALRSARGEWMLSAAILMAINLALGALRLKLVIDSMGFSLPYLRSLDAILSTWPMGVITPSRMSDILRAVVLRDICPTWEGSGGVLAEKMVDVQSLCLLAIVGSVWTGLWPVGAIALGLVLALWIGVFAVVLSGRYRRLPLLRRRADKLDKLVRVFEALRDRPGYFVAVSVTSILAWILAVAIIWALTMAFDARVDFVQCLALWPLAVFVGMLPLTVAGMGTRDAGFVSLLALTAAHGVQEAPVLAATFTYALLTAWAVAALGLPFMVRQMHLFRSVDTSGEDDE